MAFNNNYTLNVDIKRRISSIVPTFRQGDTGTLSFRIYDEGKLFDLTNYTYSEVTFELPSGQTYVGNGSLVNGLIEYQISGVELAEQGKIRTILTIQSGASRVSIQPFNCFAYNTNNQEEISYIGILQDLITETQNLGLEIRPMLDEIRDVIDEGTQLYADLRQVEQDLNNAEVVRVANENARISSENNREISESSRSSAELTRDSAEATRESNEAIREANELIRQTGYQEVKDIADNFETFDYNPGTTYVKNNVVTYNGSSYFVLQTVTGVVPTNDGTNYRLAAQRGVDGSGAVSKVNNISPDASGNVDLGDVVIGIENNLTTDSATRALAAAQGKLINDKVESYFNNSAKNVKEYGVKGDGLTDDTAALQAVLDNGGTIIFPQGTYLITSPIIIYENSHLIGEGLVTLLRGAAMSSMTQNYSDGTMGLYTAHGDITIENIVYNANGTNFSTNVSPIVFGHSHDVTLRKVSVLDTFGWHCIEMNSSKDVLIEQCTFDGLVAGAGNEMVQLDLAYSSGTFPWFGPFDNTPNMNVTINKCIFKNGVIGTGSHTAAEGFNHTGVKILDCYFSNMSGEAIRPSNWSDVTIDGCYTELCNNAIVINNPHTSSNYTIKNNHINGATARGIQVAGYTRGVKIINNFVENCGTHGIGVDIIANGLIEGNTVTGCGQAGIWSYASSDVIVKNNHAIGNVTGASPIRFDMILGFNAAILADRNIITGNIAGSFAYAHVTNSVITDNIFNSVNNNQGTSSQIRIADNIINNVITTQKRDTLFTGPLTTGSGNLTLPNDVNNISFYDYFEVTIGSTSSYGNAKVIVRGGETYSHSYSIIAGGEVELTWFVFVINGQTASINYNRRSGPSGSNFQIASTNTWITNIVGIKN